MLSLLPRQNRSRMRAHENMKITIKADHGNSIHQHLGIGDAAALLKIGVEPSLITKQLIIRRTCQIRIPHDAVGKGWWRSVTC